MKRLRFQDETKIITVFCTNLLHAHFWPILKSAWFNFKWTSRCKGNKACKPEKLRHVLRWHIYPDCGQLGQLELVLSVGLSSALKVCLWPLLRRRVCWWYWSPLPHPHPRVHSCQGARCHQNHWVGMNKKQRLLGEPELWHSAPAPGGKGTKD